MFGPWKGEQLLLDSTIPTSSKAAPAHAIGHHMNTSNVLYIGL